MFCNFRAGFATFVCFALFSCNALLSQFVISSPFAGANDARRTGTASAMLATLGSRLAPCRKHTPSRKGDLIGSGVDPAPLVVTLSVNPSDEFRGGQITSASKFWTETLLPASNLPSGLQRRITGWVTNGVDICDFFKPFSGDFMARSYHLMSHHLFTRPTTSFGTQPSPPLSQRR